uniref:Uncharacterized protein n=1 Tax=Anguilla anguilla TaxID=7936 RepID=A0A0E9QR14_ANGAN
MEEVKQGINCCCGSVTMERSFILPNKIGEK